MVLPLPEETPLNLTDSNRWTLRVSATFNATLNPDGASYSRIPEWFPDISFTSPILMVQALTTNQTSNRFAARFLQTQVMGIDGGQPVVVTARRIWLGRNLIRLAQDIEGGYQVRILPYLRMSNITLLIWEFL